MPKGMKYTKEFLISELKRFGVENGRPPISVDLDKKESGYPSRKTYVKYFSSFGDALFEAGYEYRNIETFLRTKPLPVGIKRFTKNMIKKCVDEFVSEYNRVPSLKEIESIPDYPIRADFRKLFGSFNNAIKEFGYIPNHASHYTDKELEDAIYKFVLENDRSPSLTEFNNSEYPSFWCYQDRFGSWTKALKHYNLETNEKNIDDLTDDIKKLCKQIYENEGRKIITYQDIENYDLRSSSVSCYGKHFRKTLNMTVREYVRSIGFDMPTSGRGMYFDFEDGEQTFSTYEFKVTEFLRNLGLIYNKDYFRSVKYNTFID
ncbi:homing endonuclease associated repeat-containing protein, partial [Niallia taxi]|uniref:homing endonuclease associated repeat-containing protein n=1 Tax=Niallia taxi TaxID=2499688 RepID=UPI003009A825